MSNTPLSRPLGGFSDPRFQAKLLNQRATQAIVRGQRQRPPSPDEELADAAAGRGGAATPAGDYAAHVAASLPQFQNAGGYGQTNVGAASPFVTAAMAKPAASRSLVEQQAIKERIAAEDRATGNGQKVTGGIKQGIIDENSVKQAGPEGAQNARMALAFNKGETAVLTPGAPTTPGTTTAGAASGATAPGAQPSVPGATPAPAGGPKPIGYALRQMDDGTFRGVSGSGKDEKFHTFANAEQASSFYHPTNAGGTLATALPVPPTAPTPGGATVQDNIAMNPTAAPSTSGTASVPAPATPELNPFSVNLNPFLEKTLSEPATAPSPSSSPAAAATGSAPSPTASTGSPAAPEDEDVTKIKSPYSVFTSPSSQIEETNKKLGQPRPFGFQADAIYA